MVGVGFTYIERRDKRGKDHKISVRVESSLDAAGIDRSVYDDLFGNGRRPKLDGLIAVRVRWTLTLPKEVLMLISCLDVIHDFYVLRRLPESITPPELEQTTPNRLMACSIAPSNTSESVAYHGYVQTIAAAVFPTTGFANLPKALYRADNCTTLARYGVSRAMRHAFSAVQFIDTL